MKNVLNIMKKNYMYGILIVFIIISLILGILLYRKNEEYAIAVENQYNQAFYELIDYVQNIENYLAKAMISSTPEHGAETLTNVWREANLAQVYLSQLPVSSNELSNTAKFLNQVSEYSYALSRKNINSESLTEKDLDNIETLHDYSIELRNILIQLSTDMQDGRITWNELTKNTDVAFAQQVDNLSTSSFSNIDLNFGEYEGLIYDGAFSEHVELVEKKGVTGDDIDEEKAKQITIDFIGQDKINEINSNGVIESGDITAYDFSVKIKNGDDKNPLSISISKKGGHVILMNYNREVTTVVVSDEDAKKIGKEFLNNHGFTDMKETYYVTQGGVITINYAYEQDGVIVYPDLVKLKIALDDGEILGIETRGYLNSHSTRDIPADIISVEEAKKNLNSKLEILSENMAIIPTKWMTEVFCYEFRGKIDDMDFLVYVNAKTGKEENILVIVDTLNGVLTQ